MRKWILGAIAVFLVVAAYLAATRSVKDFIEKRLDAALHEKVTLRAAHLTFPPGILLVGFSAPNFSIEQVGVRVSFFALLTGKPGLDLEVTAPKLFMERDAAGNVKSPTGEGKKKPLGLPISRLRIRAGEITFVDHKVLPEMTWLIRDLRVSLRQKNSSSFDFGVVGELQQSPQKPVGNFELKGEFFTEGTADADFSIRHEALEQLGPYVQPILGAVPSRGSAALQSKITLHEGMLIADNKLQITELSFAAADQPTILGPASGRLVELLQDERGEIHLAFVVKGRLGEPLNWSDLVNSTLREAMKQALARNIQRTLTDIEKIKPIEELIQKGLESLGR